MTMKTSNRPWGWLTGFVPAALFSAFILVMPGAGQALLAAGGQSDFAASDRDGNGSLDSEEFRDRMVETFYLLDNNGDGQLTMDELPAASRQGFNAADQNADNRLVMKEFLIIHFFSFRAADTNGDGVLSPAEVKAAEARQ